MPVYKYKVAKGYKYYFSIKKNSKRIKRTGFNTKSEAMQAERDFILNSSNITNNSNMHTLFDEYFRFCELTKKITTFHVTKLIINKYIKPFFDGYILSNVNQSIINKWIEYLTEMKISSKRKNRIYQVLRQIFNYAIENNYIDKNPCSRKSAFIDSNTIIKEINYWTEDEFNKFINTFEKKDEKWIIFFETLYYTGMRLGEIQALKWENFDIQRMELAVNKSITNKTGSSSWQIISPKTAKSNRRILLHKYLFQKLLSIKEKDSEFIFGGSKPLSSTTITRIKNKHCRLANVKQIKIHDFRHSHVSLLINKGASPSIVAERLGHSDIAMTLNTYSHLFPNEQQKIVNLL